MSIKKNLLATVSAVALSTTFASFANATAVPAAGGTVGSYTFAANVTITGTVNNAANTAFDTVIIKSGAAGDTLTVANGGTISGVAADAVITEAAAAAAKIVVNSGGTISSTTGTSISLGHTIGSITNAGTISSTTGKSIITTAAITADVTNSSGATISTTTGAGIKVTGGTLTGTLTNVGTISATTGIGVDVDQTVSGGLINSGTIKATGNGKAVDVADTMNLSITNSGTITAAGTAIALVYAGDTTSTLTNSGTISNTGTAAALQVGAAGIFTGAITNSGTITATGGALTIDIDDNVTGGLTNSATGTISTTTGNFNAINVATGKNLNITNAGTISAAGTSGVIQYAGTSTSNLTNSGTISNTSSGAGLDIDGAITGTVTNTGTIKTSTGIAIDIAAGANISGGIVNSGTISVTTAATDKSAIDITAATNVSITNSTGGTISSTGSTEATIDYIGASTATFSNAGTVSSSGAASALKIGGAFTGTITNTGTMSNASGTLGALDIDAAVSGGITNSGTITSTSGTAVDVGASTTTFTNSGTISSASSTTGETINVSAASTTNFTNSGTISTSGTGAAFNVGTAVVTGSFTNSGTISTANGGSAIRFDNAASQISAGITNTGTINAGVSGVAFDGDTSTVAQTFTNTKGTIIGDIQLGIGGTTQTLVLNGGSLDGDITGGAGVDVVTIKGDFVHTDSNDTATGGTIALGSTVGDILNFGAATTDDYTATGAISGVETINVDFGNVTTAYNITGAQTSVLTIDAASTLRATDSVRFAADTIAINGNLGINGGKTLTLTNDATTAASAVTFGAASDLTYYLGGTSAATTIGTLDATTGAGAVTVTAGGNIHVDVSSVTGAIKAMASTKILDTDTLTGTFTVTDNSAVITSAVTVTTNDVFLTLTRDGYASVSTDANSDKVGVALDALIAADSTNAGIIAVTDALDEITTAASLTTALEQLTPEVNGQTQQMAFESANASADAIDTRLASLRDGSSGIAAGGMTTENGAWAKFIAKKSDQDDRDGIAGYDADAWGVQLGGDRQLNDNVTLGVGLSYVKADADSARGDSEADTYGINLYADYTEANWYVSGTLGYGYSDYETTRSLLVDDVSQTLNGDTNGNNYTAGAEVGYTLDNTGGVKVTPNASLRYSLTQVDNYRETNGTLALNVDHEDYAKLESGLGVDVAYPINANGVTYTPELRAKWIYDFLGEEFETTSSFVAGGSSFVTQGADAAQSTFVVGLGLEVLTQDNLTVSFDYDLSAREDYDSHAGMVSARFGF